MASRILYVCLFVALFNVVSMAPADEEEHAPEFDCPNQNEYYEECELAVCFQQCKHLSKLPACPSIATGCKKPKCLCNQNYLRNDEGVCVPVQQCKEYKPPV